MESATRFAATPAMNSSDGGISLMMSSSTSNSSRLIEGQFPNYEPVIPTSHSSRAVLDREAFLAGRMPRKQYGSPSSPLGGTFF